MVAVDLNADVGESFGRWELGDDEAMLGVVTSANVACGFHAGDPPTLRRCCRLATEHGVTIGAQVSYRDLAGFGRRFIDVPPADLRDDILYQLGALEAFARGAGSTVGYVKPHGALYHAVVEHAEQARAVVSAIAEFRPPGTSTRPIAVLGPPGSVLLEVAEETGLTPVCEAFADRGYTPAGRLVPRGQPGALVGAAAAAAQAVRIATAGETVAVDGSLVRIDAASICVHGDTPGAAMIARAVREALLDAGVSVRPFAPPG